MKCYFLIITLALISLIFPQPKDKRIIDNGKVAYVSNEVILKLKTQSGTDYISSPKIPDRVLNVLNQYSISEMKQLFPSSKESHLPLIYSILYSSDTDPLLISSKLKNNPDIEWIEPRYAYEVSYIPNDPSFPSQWSLQKIQAALAWDYSTGDTNVVIGIIDTGVDWLHPDLSANIWLNMDEIPGNGIDDDMNGFVDDRVGWDFGGIDGTPDANPLEDRPEHGTHVAGISSAVSNNAAGVSSIGFRSKIMPVKTCQDNYRSLTGGAYIIYGFEGIQYAASNGAKVINCSWGGGGYSRLGQEVIDNATQLGAVVVGAAGNDNLTIDHYPSGYRNVLSVASTDEGDYKSSFSNYGYGIDVSAPGSSILSTWQGGSYTYASGTSMAAPLAAGLVALVLARYPNLSPIQAAEIVRVTCTDINLINSGYVDMLGKGRINALNSMTVNNPRSVRNIKIEFTDELGNNNGILEPGETIRVKGEFLNFLSPASNLKIFLETTSPYVNITNTLFNAGSYGTLVSFNNYNSPYTFSILQNIPQNQEILFKLYFTDGNYTDFQWVKATANQTYANQSGNDITLTITSKGALGFNDYPNNNQGIGLKYQNGGNLLFEGALIAGKSAQYVVDAVRSSNANLQSIDFSVVKPFSIKIPGGFADIEGNSIIEDVNSTYKIGLKIDFNSYSFTSPQHEKFIILRYRFKNRSLTDITNFYPGLFFDWDMVDGSGLDDFTKWSEEGKFGYTYHIGGTPNSYAGSALISSTSYGYWGILNGGGDGGFSIYDGFSKSEKWTALSSGVGKNQAGGGDISFVISGGPFNIPVNDSVDIAFAVGVGDSLAELGEVFSRARALYPSIPTEVNENISTLPEKFMLSQNYPNPFNPSTVISYQIPVNTFVTLKVFDILGNEVATLVNEEQQPGSYKLQFISPKANHNSQLSSGVYFYQIQAGNYFDSKKMVFIK